MVQTIKDILLKISPINSLRTARKKRKSLQEVKEWEKLGRPAPPPHAIKQQNLLHYATTYNLKILVETGTFNGDMVEAMKNHFDEIYSVELSQSFFNKARIRFKSQKNVFLIHGDSGDEMKTLIQRIDKPTLFWLDGHYSGGETALGEKDTPVLEELNCILDSRDLKHVIIIDDARLFGSDLSYPTIEELKNVVTSRRNNLEISIADDSIRITPKQQNTQIVK